MKRFFGIMNLILCFELIIGPHFPGTKIFSIEAAKAQTCPAGLVMDSTLNRCITSDQSAALINATASCNGDKECYKRLAEEELKKGEEEGKIAQSVANKGGLIGTGAKVAAIAGPLTVILAGLSKGGCINASGIAMIGGGLAFIVGDVMANKKHKSCLNKIKKEWEDKKAATTQKTESGVSKVSMSQDQSEAFEMLAKSEECMQSSAKMKGGFYAASTLAFGASAVLAAIEEFSLKPGDKFGGCTVVNNFQKPEIENPDSKTMIANLDVLKYTRQIKKNIASSGDLSSFIANVSLYSSESKSCASVDEYETVKSTLKDAKVNNDKTLLDYMKLAYSGIKSEFTIINSAEAVAPVGFGKFMMKATTRMILSGILTGMTAMMWMHANKQARVAKNRAEFLRKLKKEFDESTGAISCTAEERSMSANANCYCYTEGGQRNQARANSQVCQQLFSGKTIAKAGDFNSLDFSNQRVCIASNGSADENCNCKKSKSCLNAIPGGAGSLGLGAISVATNGMQPLNDLANGSIGAGSINGAAAIQGAARLLDQKTKLQNKAKLDPKKEKALSKQIQDSIIASGAGAPVVASGSSSDLPLNMSASDAAAALEKELGNEGRSFENVNGSPAVAQPGSSNPGDVEGFKLDSEEQPAAIDTSAQVAEVMAQDLDYGKSDITKSDSNIFKILSNRYQRSGMRRLFDEEGKATAEPANKNEISQ